MKTRLHVFIDIDVIFDVLASRPEHYINSAKIISMCESQQLCGYCSTITIVNCTYLMNRFRIENLSRKIELLCELLTVLPCTRDDISHSLGNKFDDFEDGVQHSIALRSKKCTHLITRNINDYRMSKLPVCTPAEFLETL